VVTVAAGGGLLSVGVASAQTPPPNLGTLTLTPATGTDASSISALPSGGCTPEGSDGYNVRVTGPNNFSFLIVGTTDAGFDKTGPFPVFFGQTMKDASALQDPPVPLVAGTYTVTLNCIDTFTTESKGTYTGSLIFSSPTAYTAGGGGPTPTPGTPTPTPVPGTPTPVPGTPTPTPVPVPGTPTPTPAPTPGATATTTKLHVFPRFFPFQGFPAILIARVSPSDAAGTVQFRDGATNIGDSVPVSGGFAFRITTTLTRGTHSLTAEFIPTNTAAFGPSTSKTVKFKVRRPLS
jgi:hypothetical protein